MMHVCLVGHGLLITMLETSKREKHGVYNDSIVKKPSSYAQLSRQYPLSGKSTLNQSVPLRNKKTLGTPWRIGQAMVFSKSKSKVFLPYVRREGRMEHGTRGVMVRTSVANMPST
jgi:hypothetical protein